MTTDELNNYFTTNYKQIRTICNNHTYKLKQYNLDVVISNLYIHLDTHKEKFDNTNIEAFIVKYTSMLKYWTRGRSMMLTETKEIEKEHLRLDIFSINEDAPIGDILDNDDNIDIEDTLHTLLKTFFETRYFSLVEKNLLTDYYTNCLKTIEDIMKFYNQRITYARKIKKELIQLENEFKEFVLNEYK